MFPAVGVGDSVNVLGGRMAHIRHSAVHLAAGGIPHLAANDIVDEKASLGQFCLALAQVEGTPHHGTGGIHITDAFQTDQQHVPLPAHPQKPVLA